MEDRPELDYQMLDREFDRTKTKVFLGKSAAFLGSIMCSMNFSWVNDIETACTDGINLWWNPHFFLALPPETRITILVHELKHPAHLDMLRRGMREPKLWNYAADIRINNELIREGYSFKGFKPWFNFDYENWVTEDIYDDLYQKREALIQAMGPAVPGIVLPSGIPAPWLVNPLTNRADESDLVEPDETDINGALAHSIVNKVVAASHQATLAGELMPGDVELTLKRFLQPKLPWETILFHFFNELAKQDYSWARPNRRYQEVYLPSLQEENGGLDHIAYFLDVSGSISDGDIIRFHSEFKYVKEHFEPEKMTMLQFDTIIQKEEVFLKEDPFEETHVIGRGGTSLSPVRQWIIDNKPTAVVVFSDLCCDVMEPLPINAKVPVIWVALNNKSAKVNEGQLVHLRE
ncbi:VWA-like domain-containing protein [Mesorhizobium sp. M0618]|uniref:vWA domain-containing protein n=1 Tax=Mesorhizobium sp. M0618 TaxID=2956972 RepID=UPI00333C3A6A